MPYRTVVLLAIVLAGCATPVGTIASHHRLGESDAAVVVGRVEAVHGDSGKPLGNVPNWMYGRMVLTAVHEGTGKKYLIACDVTGYQSDFYVSMPPARYHITEWRNRPSTAR